MIAGMCEKMDGVIRIWKEDEEEDEVKKNVWTYLDIQLMHNDKALNCTFFFVFISNSCTGFYRTSYVV